MRTSRWTDRHPHDEANSPFSQFCERTKTWPTSVRQDQKDSQFMFHLHTASIHGEQSHWQGQMSNFRCRSMNVSLLTPQRHMVGDNV